MSAILRKLSRLIGRMALFDLPGLYRARSRLFGRAFGVTNMNVGSLCIIASAHPSSTAGFKSDSGLRMGVGSYIDYSGGVTMGRDVQLSEGTRIYTHEHRTDQALSIRDSDIIYSPIEIGSFAWLGAGVIVTEAVARIGEGAIVAAGSVVTSDIPPRVIAAGVPARVIRSRSIES